MPKGLGSHRQWSKQGCPELQEQFSSRCSTQCSPPPPAPPAGFLRLSPSEGHLNEAE